MKIYKGFLYAFNEFGANGTRLTFEETSAFLYFTIENTDENMVFAREIMTDEIFPILGDLRDRTMERMNGKDYFVNEILYPSLAKLEYGFIRSRCYIADEKEIESYKKNFTSADVWHYYANRNLYHDKPVFVNQKKTSIFGEEKKEYEEDYLIKEEQMIEMLLFQVRDIDQEKYFEFVNKFNRIRLENQNFAKDIKIGSLILYDKMTLKNKTFLSLAKLEIEIKSFIENKSISYDGLLSIMLEQLDTIFNSIGVSEDKNDIIRINKISELYFENLQNFSFYNQIMLSKIISYLYILALKKYQFTLKELPEILAKTYFTNFKNSIYLVLKELLLNECIVTIDYEKLFQNTVLDEEEILSIIIDISFTNNNYIEDIKRKRLEKVME